MKTLIYKTILTKKIKFATNINTFYMKIFILNFKNQFITLSYLFFNYKYKIISVYKGFEL
jgi:hypothetical protein